MTDGEPHPETLYQENTVDVLVRRVIDIITNTRTLPFASSVKLDNKEEVLALLEDAVDRLPEELRQARWLLKEREEFLEKMQREGDDIVEAARLRAERMVERTEIVREAQHVAQRTMDDARDEARRLRLEAEDYCDQKLAAFQIVLERTAKTVQSGRAKLAVTPLPPADEPDRVLAAGGDIEESDMDFFDQDRP